MKNANDGKKDKPSNGRHILREAYAAKREKQLADVKQRQFNRSLFTPAQQIQILDMRLGVGVGAVKERARLLAQHKAAMQATVALAMESRGR